MYYFVIIYVKEEIFLSFFCFVSFQTLLNGYSILIEPPLSGIYNSALNFAEFVILQLSIWKSL
jgi:hypothetical protein